MNALVVRFLVIAMLVPGAVRAGEGTSMTVLGANEDLAAGSRALQFGSFDEGVQLTLRGLETEERRNYRAKGFSNLCAGYTAAEAYEKALAACDEALQLSDRNWRAHNNRALALTGLGRGYEARQSLARALELRPESSTLRQTSAWIEARAPRVVLANAAEAGDR